MKKQMKLVVGNWKMNPTRVEDAKAIVSKTKTTAKNLKRTQVVVCPPFIYIPLFAKGKSSKFFLGAQNAHSETEGSYTGEVSYSNLYQFGVRFVVIGHSERRKMGETDDMVNRKVKSVVNSGMSAIVCVGERERDHNGDYLDFIKNQIIDALRDVPKKLTNQIVIAYEPIWAIGASSSMDARELHQMSIYIKKVLNEMFGAYSDEVRVLYGGSVDKNNAEELVREGNVAGLLVGRESLKPQGFSEIVKIIDNIK